jgi:hypothetical protein
MSKEIALRTGQLTASSDNPEREVPIFSTVSAEKVSAADDSVLPEDVLSAMGDEGLAVAKRTAVTPDDSLTSPERTYVDRQQRQHLDHQIEALYRQVSQELSGHPEDASFALDKLRRAQDIVLGNKEQYEEALYWIFVVNQILVKKRSLRRWSYSWGTFVLVYALIWLIALLAGFTLQIQNLVAGDNIIWYAALAGGIGGVVTILWDLSWHVSVRNDFDRQYVMKYLVYPLMGLVLGGVVYLLTSAGFFVLNSVTVSEGGSTTLSAGVLAVQVVLGFVVGFRQQVVYDMVDVLAQRFSPTSSQVAE